MASTPTERLQAHVATLARQADIARVFGTSGKALRQRTRDGRVPNPDAEPDANGKRETLPPVRVSVSGTDSLTEAHKRGLVLAYVHDDEQAQAIIDAQGIK